MLWFILNHLKFKIYPKKGVVSKGAVRKSLKKYTTALGTKNENYFTFKTTSRPWNCTVYLSPIYFLISLITHMKHHKNSLIMIYNSDINQNKKINNTVNYFTANNLDKKRINVNNIYNDVIFLHIVNKFHYTRTPRHK